MFIWNSKLHDWSCLGQVQPFKSILSMLSFKSFSGFNTEIAMKRAMEHVEKNYEYVGNKFADEARAIHYGEKEEREIYGETSVEEAVDLIEEGVNVTPLPGIDPKIKN